VADPKQKSEELAREAERGRSERTPWLALTGVHLTVLAIFLVVFAIAFTAYLIA
jgi:hypothetical protein